MKYKDLILLFVNKNKKEKGNTIDVFSKRFIHLQFNRNEEEEER